MKSPPSHCPPSADFWFTLPADNLDDAKAAFRAGVEASVFEERSGRDMLSLSISAHDPGCVKTHT
jgi:hypothetical protein